MLTFECSQFLDLRKFCAMKLKHNMDREDCWNKSILCFIFGNLRNLQSVESEI